jgi:TonB family protein
MSAGLAVRTFACAVLAAVALNSRGTGVELLAQGAGQGPWQLAGRVLSATPGPFERRASLASADHPIPRRTHDVPLQYPPEAAAVGLHATVRLRLVVDERGLMAESRMTHAPVIGAFAAGLGDEGVQGTIVLDVRIEPDGHIMHARVLRSIPELDQPSLDAVRQWEFSPPLVDGSPAPVLMTITFQFSTQR